MTPSCSPSIDSPHHCSGCWFDFHGHHSLMQDFKVKSDNLITSVLRDMANRKTNLFNFNIIQLWSTWQSAVSCHTCVKTDVWAGLCWTLIWVLPFVQKCLQRNSTLSDTRVLFYQGRCWLPHSPRSICAIVCTCLHLFYVCNMYMALKVKILPCEKTCGKQTIQRRHHEQCLLQLEMRLAGELH
jgi:hypothetical protein